MEKQGEEKMIREVLMTKEEYVKLKKRFMGWIIPRTAKLKINEDDIVMIEKVIFEDKIKYWININGKCPSDEEKLKLYGFERKKKLYKGSKEEVYKIFIRRYGKKKGTVEAEEFIKKRTFVYYLPYCSNYSTVERMLKKYKEVYWLKEEYEE